MRLIACDFLTSSVDATWAMGEVFIWSCCEPFMGILCACLPTLAPLFRIWRDRSSSTNRSGNAMSSGRALEEANYKGASSATATSRMSTIKSGRQWRRLQECESSRQLHGSDGDVELATMSLRRTSGDYQKGIEGGIMVRQDYNVVSSPKERGQ